MTRKLNDFPSETVQMTANGTEWEAFHVAAYGYRLKQGEFGWVKEYHRAAVDDVLLLPKDPEALGRRDEIIAELQRELHPRDEKTVGFTGVHLSDPTDTWVMKDFIDHDDYRYNGFNSLRAAVALQEGLTAERVEFNRLHLSAPRILGAIMPVAAFSNEFAEVTPEQYSAPRWILEQMVEVYDPTVSLPPKEVIDTILRINSVNHSLVPIAHRWDETPGGADHFDHNSILTKKPGPSQWGELVLINNYAMQPMSEESTT